MRDVTGATVRPLSRVKGRFILERRLRALLVAVHRFGRHRATSRDDQQWAARTLDALTHALDLSATSVKSREANACKLLRGG